MLLQVWCHSDISIPCLWGTESKKPHIFSDVFANLYQHSKSNNFLLYPFIFNQVLSVYGLSINPNQYRGCNILNGPQGYGHTWGKEVDHFCLMPDLRRDCYLSKTPPGPGGFHDKFYQTFKESNINFTIISFKNGREQNTLQLMLWGQYFHIKTKM